MNSNKWTIIALIALFTIPVLAAIALNSNWISYKPQELTNKGTLIEPPVALAALDGVPDWEGRWSILSRCGDCARVVDRSQRWEQGLAQHYEKLRFVVVSDTESAAVRSADRDKLERWEERLGLVPDATVLVDPFGKAMMRYAPEAPPTDLLDDIERLLRYTVYEYSDG